MTAELKNEIFGRFEKLGIEFEIFDTEDVFIGDCGLLFHLNEQLYRMFLDQDMLCLEYIDYEAGDVVDVWYARNIDSWCIADTVEMLLTKYAKETWYYDEQNDTYFTK